MTLESMSQRTEPDLKLFVNMRDKTRTIFCVFILPGHSVVRCYIVIRETRKQQCYIRCHRSVTTNVAIQREFLKHGNKRDSVNVLICGICFPCSSQENLVQNEMLSATIDSLFITVCLYCYHILCRIKTVQQFTLYSPQSVYIAINQNI